ncbi:DUF3883 domain-containing protein [Candidatus Neomarinimicrobiota bacterium]
MSRVFVSPGKITALWQFLLLSSRYSILQSGISVQSAVEILKNSGLRGGGLPVEESLKFGLQYNFLSIKDSQLHYTNYAEKYLIRAHDGEEPNIDVIRAILRRVLKMDRCDWLVFFNDEVDIFKTSIPDYWIEVLEIAGLFDLSNTDTVEWWANILHMKAEYDNNRNNETGALGEELSMAHEIQRLEEDGFSNMKLNVVQVSNISDYYGFDIISKRGSQLRLHKRNEDRIKIEVKASEIENEKVFTFYVSRNEWEKAVQFKDDYFFYCWPGAKLKTGKAKGPYIVPATKLFSLICTDNSTECKWLKSRFILDLTLYSI